MINPNPNSLYKLKTMKMPFGKYAGMPLLDLPDNYVEWFYENALQNGEFGDLMKELYEIKLNGLEDLIKKL